MSLSGQEQQKLIEEAQGLVHSLASKIHRSIPVKVDYEDMVAYGEVGLAEAARDFDPSRGARFTTFAYYRVQGAIYDGLAEMSWTSRAHYRKHRYDRMANEVLAESQQGSAAAGGSLSEEVGWLGAISQKLAVVFLASQESGVGGEAAFEDPRESAGTLVARQEISEKLHQLVGDLPGVERQLIQTVYFEGSSLQEASVRLSISKSWASRLHARALEKLARELRQSGVQGTPRARTR